MTFAHPERLWLLALAVPLVLFHLRMRRRVRVVVPSLLALDPRDFAAAPPRVMGLLPRDLLGLLLEVGALAALALAFADPVEGSEPPGPRPLAIVLDGSASTMAGGKRMVAGSFTQSGGGGGGVPRMMDDRFDEMNAIARRAADAVGPDTPVSVLLAAGDVEVALAPGERTERSLPGLVLRGPRLTGSGALAVAADIAVASGGEVLVITDGCDPDVPVLASRRDLRLVSVGRPEKNRGLVGISVETRPDGRVAAFIRVREEDGTISESMAEVERRSAYPNRHGHVSSGGGALSARKPEVEVWSSYMREDEEHPYWAVGIRGENESVEADSFPMDDGVCWGARTEEPPVFVAVVSGSGMAGPWLAAALESAHPLVDPLSVTVEEAEALRNLPRPPGVVVVAAGAAGPNSRPALVFGAGRGDFVRAPAVQVGDILHPVMRGVDPAEWIITRSRVLEARAGDAVLLQGPTGPLIVAGMRDGHRQVLFGFDPKESTLPLSAGWPVLVRNALVWLVGESVPPVPPVLKAGTVLEFPAPEGAEACEVLGPEQPFWDHTRDNFVVAWPPFASVPVRGGKVRIKVPTPIDVSESVLELRVAGLRQADVSIALLDAAESDLTPVIPRNADLFVPAVRAPRGPGPRSRAGDFALGGMGLLLLEWIIFAWTGGASPAATTATTTAAASRRDSFPGPAGSS